LENAPFPSEAATQNNLRTRSYRIKSNEASFSLVPPTHCWHQKYLTCSYLLHARELVKAALRLFPYHRRGISVVPCRLLSHAALHPVVGPSSAAAAPTLPPHAALPRTPHQLAAATPPIKGPPLLQSRGGRASVIRDQVPELRAAGGQGARATRRRHRGRRCHRGAPHRTRPPLLAPLVLTFFPHVVVLPWATADARCCKERGGVTGAHTHDVN
jgi:hypothetical protein